MILENANLCTGCRACEQICPKNAIEIKMNSEGFLYPFIDANLCVDCGLCDKVCHYDKNKNFKNLEYPRAFAFTNFDKNVLMNSSSGGAFYALAEKVLLNNGIVYGCAFDSDFNARHIAIKDIKDLPKIMTSKYLESDTQDSFSEIKKYLQQGIQVMFSGTPCQVNGLKTFLQQSYDNLFCVDFICHGVPSPKFFQKYLKEKQFIGELECFTFRSKQKSWDNYSINVTTKQKVENINFLDDEYFSLFLNNLILRKSCSNCKSKGFARLSDITLADFWGVNNYNKDLYDKNGVSLVIVNNQKAYVMLQELSQSGRLVSVDFDKALKENPAYFISFQNKYRDKVFNKLDKKSVKQLKNVYIDKKRKINRILNLPSRVVRKIKNIIN